MLANAFALALREILRNPMRSALTTLGVVVGVAAVITMVTLGNGATEQVSRQIASLGSNLIMITPGQHFGHGQRGAAKSFDERTVRAIKNILGLNAVAPIASQPQTIIVGNRNWSTQVTGIDNAFFEAGNWTLQAGRKFTESELRAGAAVCVIGATVMSQIFINQDPVGAQLRLAKMSCRVIGILQSKGQTAIGRDQDNLVVIPLRTFWRRVAGNQDIDLIQVSVKPEISTQKVKLGIERLLRELRRIGHQQDDDFTARDMKEIATTLTGTTTVLTTLLGAVAAVSLLVGGIGIMNIMLVSVKERTREIGIRLAIGAMEREVLLQFLVEAVTLSTLGGLLGIMLALLSSLLLTQILQIPFIVNPGIIIVAFLFSAAVGIIFGYAPALKAARLNPIEALRYE